MRGLSLETIGSAQNPKAQNNMMGFQSSIKLSKVLPHRRADYILHQQVIRNYNISNRAITKHLRDECAESCFEPKSGLFHIRKYGGN